MKKDFDTKTYTQLYRTYVNELYSYGIGLQFGKDQCMDAIHDVFYHLAVSGRSIDEIGNIRLYLFRSLKNRLVDIYRRHKNIVTEDEGRMAFMDISVDEALSSEERNQLIHEVKILMQQLTPNQREAIYLRYMQEMEYEEVAVLLGITPESVRKLVHRAIKKLRTYTLPVYAILLLYFPRFYS